MQVQDIHNDQNKVSDNSGFAISMESNNGFRVTGIRMT